MYQDFCIEDETVHGSSMVLSLGKKAGNINSYRVFITRLSIVLVENTEFCHFHTYDLRID